MGQVESTLNDAQLDSAAFMIIRGFKSQFIDRLQFDRQSISRPADQGSEYEYSFLNYHINKCCSSLANVAFSGNLQTEYILKQGYLMKRGDVRKNWKRRWFVLKASIKLTGYNNYNFLTRYFLEYFSDQSAVEEKLGFVVLDGYRLSEFSQEERDFFGDFGMKLEPRDADDVKREWYFRCENAEDKIRWSSVLSGCCFFQYFNPTYPVQLSYFSSSDTATMKQNVSIRSFVDAYLATRLSLGHYDNWKPENDAGFQKALDRQRIFMLGLGSASDGLGEEKQTTNAEKRLDEFNDLESGGQEIPFLVPETILSQFIFCCQKGPSIIPESSSSSSSGKDDDSIYYRYMFDKCHEAIEAGMNDVKSQSPSRASIVVLDLMKGDVSRSVNVILSDCYSRFYKKLIEEVMLEQICTSYSQALLDMHEMLSTKPPPFRELDSHLLDDLICGILCSSGSLAGSNVTYTNSSISFCLESFRGLWRMYRTALPTIDSCDFFSLSTADLYGICCIFLQKYVVSSLMSIRLGCLTSDAAGDDNVTLEELLRTRALQSIEFLLTAIISASINGLIVQTVVQPQLAADTSLSFSEVSDQAHASLMVEVKVLLRGPLSRGVSFFRKRRKLTN